MVTPDAAGLLQKVGAGAWTPTKEGHLLRFLLHGIPLRASQLALSDMECWRRGWDSNPRMEVLQTSPLGHLGTAPFPITQPLTATALPSTPDLLPNLLPNSDQVFPSREFRKCCDTASAACLSAPRDR
jgi:hypothetical protein